MMVHIGSVVILVVSENISVRNPFIAHARGDQANYVALAMKFDEDVAKNHLHHGALGYGIFNGCIGLGAVFAAVLLSCVRQNVKAGAVVASAALMFTISLLVMAWVGAGLGPGSHNGSLSVGISRWVGYRQRL
jgi:hypothetical protein